jgi:zinc transport system substrate-binding protein
MAMKKVSKKTKPALIAALLITLLLVILAIVRLNNPAILSTNLDVTATYYPLFEFAKQIGGNKINAQNITPAGAEPHDFEPTPQQLAKSYNSKVFVYNGINFEPWTDGFLQDYKNITVKSSENVRPLPIAESSDQFDPHFWLDPVFAIQMVDNILNGLKQASPQDKDYFQANASAYKAELEKLNQDFAKGLENCRTRTIVTSHEAFSYLAARYNLNMVAIAGISPDEEPSPAKLAKISEIVKNESVQYIFFENLVSPRLADTIANETGAKTAVLDPIEGLTSDDQRQGKNYISVQRENLANLRAALACE